MNNGFVKNLQQEYISIKINKIWINIDYAVLLCFDIIGGLHRTMACLLWNPE